ncbi:hypothetical protein OSTOST_20401 [Ostertagia ostertagi]
MRTLNMVRLSFSDDSETPVNSTPIVKTNSTTETSDGDDCFKALPITPTTDDTEYDTIGTPRLTHNPCQAGTCSGGCLAASIITSLSSTKSNTLAYVVLQIS